MPSQQTAVTASQVLHAARVGEQTATNTRAAGAALMAAQDADLRPNFQGDWATTHFASQETLQVACNNIVNDLTEMSRLLGRHVNVTVEQDAVAKAAAAIPQGDMGSIINMPTPSQA